MHLHFPLPLGMSVLIVRALVKRPLVVTVHGNADVYELPRAMEPLTRAVLQRADVVVSVSEDLGAVPAEGDGRRQRDGHPERRGRRRIPARHRRPARR